MKLARGVTGVFAGYGTLWLIWHFFAPAPTGSGMGFFLLSAMWTVVGAMIGGYITAWIAGRHELPYAAVLGLVLITVSVTGMIRAGASRPGFYEASIAGCGPMAALLGAAIRMLVKSARRS